MLYLLCLLPVWVHASPPFVISMWCGVPASQLNQHRFDEIAAAGFTHAINPCDGSTYNAGYNVPMLTMARAAGLSALPFDQRTMDAASGSDVDQNLDGIVKDYASLPGLTAYSTMDEPGASQFANLAKVISGVQARDPAHYSYINLLPNYASPGQMGVPTYPEYVSLFLNQTKPRSFSYDFYPFLTNGDSPGFFDNLEVVAQQARIFKTPWWQYIQSIAFADHRPTTEAEKLWQGMHTIVYGGTGVCYFTYWTPGPTPEAFEEGIIAPDGTQTVQYGQAQRINPKLKAIGGVTATANWTGAWHNGGLPSNTFPRPPFAPVYIPSGIPVTVGMFDYSNGNTLSMLVNKDYTQAQTSYIFLASADNKPLLLNVSSGQWIAPHFNASGYGLFTILPGDALLFLLKGPLPKGPPGAEAFVGTVRSDAGTFFVVDQTFGTQALRPAGWDECPAGYILFGRDFESFGFWLCARNDLVSSTFYFGNVVKDEGAMFQVSKSGTQKLGDAGWNQCPASSKLLGTDFNSNGFWICLLQA